MKRVVRIKRECSICAPIDRENMRRQYAAMGVGKV